jgi:hypothetical protein
MVLGVISLVLAQHQGVTGLYSFTNMNIKRKKNAKVHMGRGILSIESEEIARRVH